LINKTFSLIIYGEPPLYMNKVIRLLLLRDSISIKVCRKR
jgi:hypothetical protein